MKWSLFVFLTLVASSINAQEQKKTTHLTVSPAAAPYPALKYELLPDLRDQTSGNAALYYYRATNAGWLHHRSDAGFNEKMGRWLDSSLENFPREELRWLNHYSPLKELELGARKGHCDWELTERLRSEGIRATVPEIGAVRELSLLLVLRARMAMSEGNFEQAIHSLQTGFSVARHLNQAPTMIFGLTGHAIAGSTAREVERLIQQPNAPNLYWALATLPVPFANLREAMQGDRLVMTSLVPNYNRLEKAVLTTEEARDFLGSLYYNQGIFGGGLPKALQGPQGIGAFFPAMMVAKNYARAKRYLLDHEWPTEKVDAMPAPQVVLLYAALRSRAVQDEALKWCSIPYWQARPFITQTMKKMNEEALEEAEHLPFLGVSSASDALLRSVASTDRRFALLRCIEALRLHAAANDGKLPSKLSDITVVPIPLDPTTGKDFLYEVEDGKAIIASPPVDGKSMASERYEITMRR